MNVKVAAGDGRSGECVSRAEALLLLGVKPETLYSYVSRGLIRRVAVADGRSLYAREDVDRVRARSVARSGHGPVAAAAVHWGEPILTTRLTRVTAEGPAYRGLLAAGLAKEGRKFEAVAQYLWTGSWDPPPAASDPPASLAGELDRVFAAHPGLHVRYLMAHAVLALSYQPPAPDAPVAETGRKLLRAIVGTLGFLGPAGAFRPPLARESLGVAALRGLGARDDTRTRKALEAALILCADHDLTPATFAGRIAASIGADLYACIGAALNAHFGAHFGLGFDRLESQLHDHFERPGAPPDAPENQVRYHHPLYPKGDPRAQFIIDAARDIAGRGDRVDHALALLTRGVGRTLEAPTIEEALATFAHALNLPRQSSGALFTLGRAAGWLAHAHEQKVSGTLIRPRARFLAADEPA